MFKNTAIKIGTTKLASVSLLSSSLVLVSGIVVWRLWKKQTQLQTKTGELSDELKHVKKQVAEIKAGNEETSSLSSSFKKMASFNPWSSSK